MKVFIQILSGVTGRFLIVLLAMAGMTGAAVFVSNKVFNAIAEKTYPLTQNHLPDLEYVATVGALTGDLRDELADVLLAPTTNLLTDKRGTVSAVVKDTQAQIAMLDDDVRAEMSQMLSATHAALNELIDARTAEIVAQNTISKASAAMETKGADVANLLLQMTDDARAKLVRAGRETVKKVDDTLTQLVEEDFKAFELALTVRSEIGFLSGAALTLAETRDQNLKNELNKLGLISQKRLVELLPQLNEYPSFADVLIPLKGALSVYEQVLSGPPTIPYQLRAQIIEKRTVSNSALDGAIEDTMARLTKRVAQTSSSNASAIKLLIEWQLVELIELNTMDGALKTFFIVGLHGSAAPDVAQAQDLQNQLSMKLLDLQIMASDKGLELADLVENLMGIADPNTGIVAARVKFLNARREVSASSAEATTQVLEISKTATALGARAITKISEVAELLNQHVANASSYMQTISVASVVLFLIAPILTYRMIVRPLRLATEVTVRLASGDIAELTGLKHQSGEIGSLTRALNVFRSNLVDKKRMEKEQAKAALEKREAEEQLRQSEITREAQEKARETEHFEKERQRKEAETVEREKLRSAADKERQILTAQQDQVVTVLAGGLQKLAAGDLQVQINESFADRYETLRADFNVAVANLSGMIRSITSSALSIDNSSGEISNASLDLSRQTELSAAALGETSVTLSELTESVQSTADGALQADKLVNTTRKNAEQSSSVVREAVEAMEEIEGSSKQISKITSVIDDISFQTNLLALNAGVEAARAGDSGRGFAVVASEVRALAQRSSDAAKEISTLLTNSRDQVSRGVKLVDKAGKELDQIISEVEGIADHVSNIAVSAKAQSTGITEVNATINQLDSVTQKNAAMFEETTAASQSLSREATTLTCTVGAFSIGEIEEMQSEELWSKAS